MSDKVSDQVNKLGWDEAYKLYPEVKIQLDVKFSGGSKGYSDWMSEYYTPVCEIEADDLEEVFHIGNMGPEERIKRLAPMHSVSVGDIVECDGTKHMVDGFGFAEIA